MLARCRRRSRPPRGELLIALGRIAGMVAAYAMLVLVLLVARLPPVERAVGHDQLVAWHRRLGPWPLSLVARHGALVVLGYARQARTGPLPELWTLLSTDPGVLAGTVGFLLLVAAGVSSYRAARLWWTLLWLGAAALVLAFRAIGPLVRSLRHRLVAEAVEPAGPDALSIVLRGRALQLPAGEPRSVQINAFAAPQLRAEALAASSATVDAVSGATITSDAYLASLRAALARAGVG